MSVEIKKENGFEYVEEGNGPVIILLHGLFGALSNFKDVIDYFKDKYTVAIPLMPVYTMPREETSLTNLSKHIYEFIQYKKYTDVTLLGNSMGGHIGLIFTSEHPELVKYLVLTGSSGLYEKSFGSTYPRKSDYDFIKERVEQTFYFPEVATKELIDEVFDLVNDKEKALRSLLLAKSAMRHNMAPELPKIKQPVCLIWGKNDTITPPEVADEMHKIIPDSDLFWIDKCGHVAMMEHPQEFNEILEKWLESRK